MSDKALLAACVVGDSAALGALYDRLSADVWRFLSRMAGNRIGELEDLMQATFVSVHTSAARFMGTSSVRTWVFRIAVNITRQHHRNEARRRCAFDRLAASPIDPVGRPDESVQQRQLELRMRAAIWALPHNLRVALVMCDLEDIPGKEAAVALEIPEGTLYRRVHEARGALRAFFEDDRI
jgi:RNA polymerase sigma-70 factor (ECF subfamily)